MKWPSIYQLGSLGSTVGCPIEVWDKTPAKNIFCISGLKIAFIGDISVFATFLGFG